VAKDDTGARRVEGTSDGAPPNAPMHVHDAPANDEIRARVTTECCELRAFTATAIALHASGHPLRRY
jgi:hypothetical protein